MTVEERAAALSHAEIVALLEEHAALKQQNAWFKRQLFGRKSERRLRELDPQQLPLGLVPATPDPADSFPSPTETVKANQRRAPFTALATGPDEGGLRFDASVSVEVIPLPNPASAALPPEAYEIIGEKVTYRLAQRPRAYVVLKYVRPVVKVKAAQTLVSAPAPAVVLERSYADVSLLAGLLVDNLRYHLPSLSATSALGGCWDSPEPRHAHAVGAPDGGLVGADLPCAAFLDSPEPGLSDG